MGYELARIARKRGFKVTLISGPVSLVPPAGVKYLYVETARQLQKSVLRGLGKADILVMTSAVADFRPAFYLKNKVKSKKGITLKLIRNTDILGSIPRNIRKNRIIVGFSLETKALLANSSRKLKTKKLDLIVANKCGSGNTPFGRTRSTVYLLDKHGGTKKLNKATKTQIALAILDTINELCYTPN